MNERVYFRQLLAGRDFALDDPLARQMVNFVYAVGDIETGEALLIDPAYRPRELVELVELDGLRVVGALATHYHFDHVGGSFMGREVDGLRELLEVVDVPVHVQRDEVPWIERSTGVGVDALVAHDSSDVVNVGAIEVTLLHTPGHTPGSQCLLVEGRMISGDTLFLEGCGRTDLPGSDPEEMYRTLTQRLSAVSNETVLYPGHNYSSDPSAVLGDVRATNCVLTPRTAEEWLAKFA
jgi:hydroxyacylglutathione hydrolase